MYHCLCVLRRYQIYATMVSFYVPLSVMIVVYGKILRVVAEKKKHMTWTSTSHSRSSSADHSSIHLDQHRFSNPHSNGLNLPVKSPSLILPAVANARKINKGQWSYSYYLSLQ